MLKKFLKRGAIFFGGLILLLAIILFLSRDYLSATLTKKIDSTLAEQGVHLTYTTTDFDIFTGLGLEDLTLYESAARETPVIALSNIAVGYKLADLVFSPTKRSAVLQVEDSTLTAYHEGEAYRLEKLNGSVSVSQTEVDIADLTAQLFGLDLDVAGNIKMASSKAASTSKPDVSSEDDDKTPYEGLDLSPIAALADAMKLKAEGEAPKLTARFTVNEDQTVEAKTTFSGKKFSWDGVPIDSLTAEVEVENGANAPILTIKRLELQYAGRPLKAEGSFDLDTEVFALKSLDSKIDLMKLASHFEESGDTSMLRFLEPPNLVASGTIPIAEIDKAVITGSANCPQGVEIAFKEDQKLVISNVTTTFSLSEGLLKLPDLSSNVLGGATKINMSLKPFSKVPYMDGTFALEKLSLAEIAKFAGQANDKVGTLSASFTGAGEPDLKKLNGTGNLEISEAHFVSIPIFRKILPVLSAFALKPFNGNSKGTSVTATFALKDAQLTTSDVQLLSGIYGVDGTADVNFATETLAATASVKPNGPMKVISKLSERTIDIEASGTFDNYDWRVKNIPGVDRVSTLAGVPQEKLGDMLQKLGIEEGSASKTAQDIIKATESIPFLKGLNKKLNLNPTAEEEAPPKATKPE
tara:strand:+ start:1131 stop:3047 length:1917 start_codon:yes stop_codon:yes gene_type:complete